MKETSVGFDQPALFVHYLIPFEHEWKNGGTEVLVSPPIFKVLLGFDVEANPKPKENPKFPSSV